MMQATSRQALTFVLVGTVVFAADYAAFALTIALLPNLLVPANVIGRSTGALTGFVLHGRYTFGTSRQSAGTAVRYAGLFVTSLLLSSSLLWFAVTVVDVSPLPARLAVDCLTILCSFLGQKLWVFR